jgi:hypothetical protein
VPCLLTRAVTCTDVRGVARRSNGGEWTRLIDCTQWRTDDAVATELRVEEELNRYCKVASNLDVWNYETGGGRG